MKKKNLYSARFRHVDNCEGVEKAVFTKKLESLDRKKYLGFIEERTYTTIKGKVIIEVFLIPGEPTKRFRDSIKKAGLLNTKFGDEI